MAALVLALWLFFVCMRIIMVLSYEIIDIHVPKGPAFCNAILLVCLQEIVST